MVRSPSCDKSGLRKGTWTEGEDRKLIAYVTRYGCWNWRQLPKFAGLSRCGKSCRLRWLNYLRPNIKRGNYTKEEEDTIIKLHKSLGNKWSAISAQLPGRTDNEIKNHWHTTLKKRVMKDNSWLTNNEAETRSNNIILNSPERRITDHDETNYESKFLPNSSIETSEITLSPHASSSHEFSVVTTGTNNVADNTSANLQKMDDSFSFSEAFEEIGYNFWTDPFFVEPNYNFIGNDTSCVDYSEFFSPVFVESFCPDGLYR